MPELALVMANYFNSISKYCFSIYRGYTNNDEEIQKRKKEIRNQKNMRPPKKPLTAYLLFYSDRLCEVQKENPSNYISIQLIVSKISAELSPSTGATSHLKKRDLIYRKQNDRNNDTKRTSKYTKKFILSTMII